MLMLLSCPARPIPARSGRRTLSVQSERPETVLKESLPVEASLRTGNPSLGTMAPVRRGPRGFGLHLQSPAARSGLC